MASFEEMSEEAKLALGRFAHTLIHRNPEVAREARKLAKKANPELRFPEIETEERVNEQLAARDKKIEELEARQMQEEADRRREQKRAACVARGLDPDKVEALMIERGKQNRVIDYETAMEFLEMQGQLAAASPASDPMRPGNRVKSLMEDKDLWTDPSGTAAKRTHEAIDELNAMRARQSRRA